MQANSKRTPWELIFDLPAKMTFRATDQKLHCLPVAPNVLDEKSSSQIAQNPKKNDNITRQQDPSSITSTSTSQQTT